MKRFIFGLLFAIFGVSSAFAGCPAGTYFTTNETNCIFVSPTNPLPVTGSFSATTTEKSTAAAPTYIEGSSNPISGDLNGNLRTTLGTALPAGSAIVGKVGIDQTTPGTTNGVVVNSSALPTGAATAASQGLGTRPKVVTTTFTPAASGTYSNGLNIGGKLTFATGLPAGTSVLLDTFNLAFGATSLSGAAPSINAFIFNSNPVSTFTDGSAFTVNAADAAILVRAQVAPGISIQATNLWANSTAANLIGTEATVDASGNIYVALDVGGAAPTYGASPGTATAVLGLRY